MNEQYFFSCINNNDECKITKETRVNCKSCRYYKCIEVGMVQKRKDPDNEYDESSHEMEDGGIKKNLFYCKVKLYLLSFCKLLKKMIFL